MKSRIVAAACRLKGTDEIVVSARHFDVRMHRQIEARVDQAEWYGPNVEQGFVDQFGAWWSRVDALVIAKAAGQLRPNPAHSGDELYTEDLY